MASLTPQEFQRLFGNAQQTPVSDMYAGTGMQPQSSTQYFNQPGGEYGYDPQGNYGRKVPSVAFSGAGMGLNPNTQLGLPQTATAAIDQQFPVSGGNQALSYSPGADLGGNFGPQPGGYSSTAALPQRQNGPASGENLMALPGQVPGATAIPRASGLNLPTGKPTMLDMLGDWFGGTTAGGLMKNLAPDAFYGFGEMLKGKPQTGAKSLPQRISAPTPSQTYAAKNANAKASAQAGATRGYTPSSSGQSGDWFSTVTGR